MRPAKVNAIGWVEIIGPRSPDAKRILDEAKANQLQRLPSPRDLLNTNTSETNNK
jgi:hypothetical protein